MDAASAPMHKPHSLRGWLNAAGKTYLHAGEHKLALLAAGVAFFGFLAIFPALGAVLMVWGLFAEPADVFERMGFMRSIMPAGAFDTLVEQLLAITRTDQEAPAGSTLGAIFALAFAIWAASKGSRALILALNVAYEVEADRSIIRHYLIALGFTVGGVAFMVLSVAAIAAIPPILQALSLGLFAETLIHVIRWAGVIALFLLALSLLYYWAPAGEKPRYRLLSPGSLAATALWIVVSAIFSIYAQNFGNYNETFGSLGAAAALLMWLWLSAFVVCLGAQFNAVLTGLTGKHLPIDAADVETPAEPPAGGPVRET
jgi:membrane protein